MEMRAIVVRVMNSDGRNHGMLLTGHVASQVPISQLGYTGELPPVIKQQSQLCERSASPPHHGRIPKTHKIQDNKNQFSLSKLDNTYNEIRT